MNELNKLLNKVSRIITADYRVKEERKNKGENYNIFKVLKLSRDERRLHSSFIADLLDDKSEHGLKKEFLNTFLKKVNSKIELEGNIKVFTEYYIGPLNEEKTEGGILDILIEDSKRKAIIIENKIDANDEENQLLRYNNFAKKKYIEYELIYLTPTGCEANEKSTRGENFDYTLLSYTAIIEWIEECIKISASHPLIRETLVQYSINLKEILGMMNNINMKDFLEITTCEENVEATLKIIEQTNAIQQMIRDKFVENIKKSATEKGYSVEVDEDFCSLGADKWIKIFKKEYGIDYCLVIGWTEHNSSEFGGARIGIMRINKSIENKNVENIIAWSERKPDSDYPYGWETLGGMKNKLWNWRNIDTIVQMSNGKLLDYLNKELFEKEKEYELLRKIHNR